MNNLSQQMLPKRIAGLNKLAYNLWWSWHPEARNLFKVLDRPLWKASYHNPVQLLQSLAPHRLVAAAQDLAFLRKYDSVMTDFDNDMAARQTWLHTRYPHLKQQTVAYLSMEFAIHNSLPLYAGGLGVLAGDYCKEASDLGLSMVGVGFMYPQGYFHQLIREDGWQEEIYRHLDFGQAPITQVLTNQKQPMKLEVQVGSRLVHIGVWQVNVGRVRLYLLDTDLPDNSPDDRQLSARLYAGDQEMRLQQEIVLGIGGVRALRALGIEPSVWHANEGHVAFMMLERCRELLVKGLDFTEALGQVQATTVFTTHTPVPAGNDAFTHSLVEKYFADYWGSLGLDREAFLKLGAHESGNGAFSMTVLALKLARQRNAVSQLHGAVCRRMWHSLWPAIEEKDVPISSVTNGIHVPTWIAPQMAKLYEKYLGPDWLNRHDDPALWAMHRWLKQKLIGSVRDWARRRWRENCAAPIQALATGALLDTETLTIVFSRRFTDYKRAALILRDIPRLRRLLQDELCPIQIIFSGKAHPNDHHGKCLIQEIYSMAKNPDFNGRIAFVEDYDMHISRYFVQGADIWLNTPRPFQEASGTSGMKATLNGVLHLSVLDGWWYEAYDGTNGWAICDGSQNPNTTDHDARDADELYHLLEEKATPLYYERDMDGVPHGWVKMMKQTIRSIAPLFSARRMVKEYTEQLYLPAAQASLVLRNGGTVATSALNGGGSWRAGRHPGIRDELVAGIGQAV
jgi:starch phosphorylase